MTVNLGPLALPAAHVMFLSAALVAALAGNWAGRKSGVKVGPLLLDMLLAGLVAGRVAFVAVWFAQYRAAPWTMLDIRDGGIHPLAGALAAAGVALWRLRQRRALREPFAAAMLAGAMAWLVSGAPALLGMKQDKQLPALVLHTLGGKPVGLDTIAQGKPMVVNLWATWCPPCRREMPVFADAQRRERDIVFAFANQGEEEGAVRAYLDGGGLHLSNVLIDRARSVGKAVGSTAYPTTLFYDGSGRLIEAHLGPLSAATLAARLDKLRPPP